MQHGYMYSGSYELNYPTLRAGSTSYKTTEGETRTLPAWSSDVDGVHFTYMERTGKKFFAVRAQYGPHDIVLENPVAIDPMRHLDNRRLTAETTTVSDALAEAMLDDMIRDNPDKREPLARLINQVNQTRRDRRETKS